MAYWQAKEGLKALGIKANKFVRIEEGAGVWRSDFKKQGVLLVLLLLVIKGYCLQMQLMAAMSPQLQMLRHE